MSVQRTSSRRSIEQCRICSKSENDQMVLCDGPCSKWFHLECVHMTEAEAQAIDKWVCEYCKLEQINNPANENMSHSKKSTVTRQSKCSKASEMLKLREEILQREEEILQREKKLIQERKKLLQEQMTVKSSNSEKFKRQGVMKNVENCNNQIEHQKQRASNVIESQLSQNPLMRYSMVKDLPMFSGRPEEWPIFISAYEHSTAFTGCTNYENLLRLQKALKGKAREVVECQLSLPACVPKIIETLRTMFGRPELILNSQIMKIRMYPAVKSDKLETLINFSTVVQNLCATLEASQLLEYDNSPLLVQELVEKLPTSMKLEWSRYSDNLTKLCITSFGEWLNDLAMCAWKILPTSSLFNDNTVSNKHYKPNHMNVHVQNDNDKEKTKIENCPACKKTCKSLEKCNEFLKLTPHQRWKMVQKEKICRQCLKHIWKFQTVCPAPQECGKENCKFNHHPLLHEDKKHMELNKGTPPLTTMQQFSHSFPERNVLFQYMPVVLKNEDKELTVIAFIDGGSDGTFLEQHIAEKLSLKGPTSTLCIKWSDDTQRIEQESMSLSLKIRGDYNKAKEYTVKSVQTVKLLNLPEQTLKYEEIVKRYPHLKKLPIKSYEKAAPGLLIGVNNWKLGITQKYREGKDDNEPIAIKSKLGWTICANVGNSNECTVKHFNFHIGEVQAKHDHELNEMVKKYFNFENLGIQLPNYANPSKEERRAIEIMESTTFRVEDRFETGLLWKDHVKNLPNSRITALQRSRFLEKRLGQIPSLKENMNTQIEEYLEKGYIRKLSTKELEESHDRIWYLPIFPVINPNKPGKVRMVWDAAAKTEGISLNSLLLKGPDQLSSLVGIIHRARERKILFCGDIAEMFHQVKINKEDQHAQRFLWCWDPNSEQVDTYVMQVMTFGASCSPSLAQYVKNINATEFKDEYPKAVDAIINDHYVDDLLTSTDTEDEAIELAEQIKLIHAKGGFHMRKWKSNSAKVTLSLEGKTIENDDLLNFNMETETEKVLGMWWNMKEDVFTYSLKFNNKNREILACDHIPTKREILRILMSVYDPLGLIAHYLTYLKVLLQEVWRTKVDWDEKIQTEQQNKWINWVRQLPQIEKIKIPRCYLNKLENWQDVRTQLHIFVDASKDVCAALAYIRVQLNDVIECTLIGAKTRVAPLKLTSIPRLELISALIGARYSETLSKSLSINIEKIIYWSDSKTVLSWLRSDAKRIKGQFIAFRVAEIQDITEIENWRYVPTDENVADDATKWQKSLSFNINDRWYQGPPFLLKDESNWPENIEVKKSNEEFTLSVHLQEKPIIIDFHRFSDWTRLLKTIAYVYRFYEYLKAKKNNQSLPKGHLTTEELQLATTVLYKLAQAESYPQEVKKLLKAKLENKKIIVDNTSTIYNCSPILDSNDVLRVKGRISAADYIDDNFKRPVILDRNHYITKLLVKKCHEMYYHINHETVINELRQRYYIGRLRPLLKSIRYNCQKCKITNSKPCKPEMASLPTARLAAFTRPFTYVGVDYFGPIKVINGRKTEKRWGCLFTCLTIRAIHIEIAHGLDTEAFILCYRNFINRRGQPKEIYCDCGTNFVSADRELRKEMKKISHEKISKKLTTLETKFKFNPPASPHMGGSWERLVRSVKNTLYSIEPTRTPNEYLLRTYLIEVENIINSRPLTYLPLDSEQSEALTPNHFILGSSNGIKTVGTFSDDAKLLKPNWLMTQLYARRFWKRWINEYLPTLTRRPKWCAPEEPLQEGDIVIIVDGNNPRNTWPKGRIIETFKSKDGQVRSVKLQTINGIYKRPAVKLAKLDTKEKCAESV